MNDSLQITTLGQFTIRRNGTSVTTLATRKAEALLVYLACTGKAHPREHLAELLWQDRSQVQSLTNLRTTLSRLSEHLSPFLHITRKTVAIHPQAQVRIDAVALHTALQANQAPLSTSSAHRLERALTLYGGDFLSGFSLSESQEFEKWLMAWADQLRVGVMEALSQLVTFSLLRADFAAGVKHASQLLSLDPLREDTHRQMMQLLAGLGQRRAALAQYDRCRQILSEELGIEPEAATTTLSEHIRTGTFVPPATPPPPMNTVPVQLTRFLGREGELRQIEEMLDHPDCRLLTLVGPGGVGKTRLAYEVGRGKVSDFATGVCAIPLAGLASPEYLVSIMAERLQVRFHGSTDQKAQLLAFLREKHLLLMMDNCEHMLDGMGLLTEILGAAPAVKILATSRERLGLQGEWLFSVQGLPFPQSDTLTEAESSPAIQLFDQSARRLDPGFQMNDVPAVARICALVEGLPLAIELAAPWVHQMPVSRIATHLEHTLDLLSSHLRDVPERHRSIRALFEHSWRLLSRSEQSVLRKLSVFGGDFEADAAAQVAGATLSMLSTLADKSLVRPSPSGRYDLHELLRQFASEKLREADEETATQDRHLDAFLTWAEQANRHLRGPEQVAWFQRIETEQDNLRVALAFGIGGPRAESGLRLANALWWFWFRRGYGREGSAWFKAGLSRTQGETAIRAYALYRVTTLQGQAETSCIQGTLEKALRIAEQLELHELVAMSYASKSFGVEDYQAAQALLERAVSLLREADARFELTAALFLYGDRARAHGDLSRAEALYQESLAIAQQDQDQELMISPLGNLGRLAASGGDYTRAATLLRQAVAIGRELGNPVEIADWLVYLGTVEHYQGEDTAAEMHLEETQVLFRELGNLIGMAHVSHCLADLALSRGQDARAAELIRESLSLSQRVLAHVENREWTIVRLLIVGQLALRREQYPEAAQMLGAVEALQQQTGTLFDPLHHKEYSEVVAHVRAQLETAAFEAAWTQGAAMSEAEAISSALAFLQVQGSLLEGRRGS